MSNKGRPPYSEDQTLWERFTQGIKPLLDKPTRPLDKSDELLLSEGQQDRLNRKTAQNKKTPEFLLGQSDKQDGLSKTISPLNNDLDRKTLAKLRRGKMPIEGILDLHHKTQNQAYDALVRFVSQAVAQEKRCILIITGKGRNTKPDYSISFSKQEKDGVLKSSLPEWVSLPPLCDMILRIHQAHRSHGGSGAFYLYLKKQR